MSESRYINTKFWSDNFIVELDPIERYLFLYFLTNEHTNIAGIYELPLRVMSYETGLDKEMLLKIIDRFKGKINYFEGWIYIKNFNKNQKLRGQSIDIAIKKLWDLVPKRVSTPLRGGVHTPRRNINRNVKVILKDNIKLNTTTTTISEAAASRKLNEFIDKFKTINPSYKKFFANKTQRNAMERLLKQNTEEQINWVLNVLPKTNIMKFAPNITTPLQLEDKLAALISFLKKEKDSVPQIIKIS